MEMGFHSVNSTYASVPTPSIELENGRDSKRRKLCGHSGECGGGCGCGGSIATSSSHQNPYTPHFNEYHISIPQYPVVHPEGTKTSPLHYTNDMEHGEPIGVAINGVLIFGHHVKYHRKNDSATIRELKRDFDNCGGHGDKIGRYHYHGAPVCMMIDMHMTVPDTGASFLREKNSTTAISLWPTSVEAHDDHSHSPILGFALDGFPIHGPYHVESGVLMTTSDLDECNYDILSGVYYFTPDYPFAPTCLVGQVGTYSNSLMHEGVCPKYGIDNVYCEGEGCNPENQECERRKVPYDYSVIWWFTAFSAILMAIYVTYSLFHFVFIDNHPYPLRVAIFTVCPAFVLLLSVQNILKAFYGVPTDIPGDFAIDVAVFEQHANEVVGSYLSVVGVLYSLVVAHLLGSANTKFVEITNALITEVATVERLLQLINTISIDNTEGNIAGNKRVVKKMHLKKVEAVEILQAYVTHLIVCWGDSSNPKSSCVALDIIYSVMPIISNIVRISSSDSLNVELGARCMDSVNEIAVLHVQRSKLERVHIPPILWLLNTIVSASMFFGIAMIYSGSGYYNATLCFIGAMLIAVSTHAIADLDSPYYGYIQMEKSPVFALDEMLHTSLLNRKETLGGSTQSKVETIKAEYSFYRGVINNTLNRKDTTMKRKSKKIEDRKSSLQRFQSAVKKTITINRLSSGKMKELDEKRKLIASQAQKFYSGSPRKTAIPGSVIPRIMLKSLSSPYFLPNPAGSVAAGAVDSSEGSAHDDFSDDSDNESVESVEKGGCGDDDNNNNNESKTGTDGFMPTNIKQNVPVAASTSSTAPFWKTASNANRDMNAMYAVARLTKPPSTGVRIESPGSDASGSLSALEGGPTPQRPVAADEDQDTDFGW
jgi:hypothetical protein